MQKGDESLPWQQQDESKHQRQLAEVSVRLHQVKFVQPNLAVADGFIQLLGNEEDVDCYETTSAKRRLASTLGFVNEEPCSVFLRARDDVQKLRGFAHSSLGEDDNRNIDKNHLSMIKNEATIKKKGTGRWLSLATNDENYYYRMEIQTVLTRATERNRKGTRLIECHSIMELELRDKNLSVRKAHSENFTVTTATTATPQMAFNLTAPPALSSNASCFQMFDKSQRQYLFANWLIATYGKEFLCQGSGVLDVAGGKGDLSRALQQQGIPSVVLDPNPRLGPDTSGIPVITLALQGDGSHLFYERKERLIEDKSGATTGTATAREQHLIRTCSMIVGMHADEATEPILELAQFLGSEALNGATIKPVAILPCCVMPSLFPIVCTAANRSDPTRFFVNTCNPFTTMT